MAVYKTSKRRLRKDTVSFLCVIHLYFVFFGVGDGGYLNLGVGAGAGVRVDQAEVRTPL